MAQLKKVNINGLTFQYINYGENEEINTSVDGLVIPVNDVKQSLLDVGGFYKDLLTPLKEDDGNTIKRVVVLSVTEAGMSQLTGFFFDNGQKDMKASWTTEPKIVNYYKSHIDKKAIPYEPINSLEFLANLGNDDSKKYFNILNSYYNPIATNDTGIVIDGKIVPYGSKLTINNFKTMLDRFPNLKNSNLGRMNIDKMEVTIYDEGPSLMGTIGSGKMYSDEGRLITTIEDYYHSYINNGENEDVEPYEDFLVKYHQEELHGLAITINRRLRGQENKEEVINKYVKQYEEEKEELEEPAVEMIGLNLLLESIKEGLAEFDK